MSVLLEEDGVGASGGGLRGHLDVVRRRKWIVAAVFAVAAIAAAVVSELATPVYRAQSKIVIGQGQSLFQVPNGNVIQPFTATMSDLMKSNVVAVGVIRGLGLDDSPQELLSRLSVSINPDTAVITASYDSSEAPQATRVLEEIDLVFARLVRERFGSASAPAGGGATPPITATVFDPAHPLPGRVSPKPVRNVAVAAVLGLLLGLVAAFLREHFDRGLRSREAVERAFGVPVIGQIPFDRSWNAGRVVAWEGTGQIAEAYRGLRANLQYLGVQRPLRTVLVTSATPRQGKTTVAANLAVAIARAGASTAVVEADLRRPRLDTALGVDPSPAGLTTVLVGNAALEDVAESIELPLPAVGREAGQLAFVPSGPLPPNPSELLASPAMQDVLDGLAASFDHVLIDSPPLLPVADALMLGRNVDGVVVAVRRGEATSDDAREVRAVVERLGIPLLGVIFTDVEPTPAYGYDDAAETVRDVPAAPVAAAPLRIEPSVGEEL